MDRLSPIGLRHPGHPFRMLLAATLTASPLAGQSVVSIPDPVECRTCRIQARIVGRIGSESQPVTPSPHPRVVKDRSGRHLVSPTYEPDALAIFDAEGRFVRVAGPRGEGPGEFRLGFVRPLVGPGDTTLVIDQDRLTVFTPGLEELVNTRHIGRPPIDAAVLPDGRLLLLRPDPGGSGFHVLDWRTGTVESAGGSRAESVGPFDALGVLAVADSAPTFWVGRVNRYEVEKRGVGGRILAKLQRSPPWFEPWSEPAVGAQITRPPMPLLMDLQVRGPYLWTIVLVPDPDWSPPQRPAVRGEGPESNEPNRNTLFDTIIEVIDPDRGRVVARFRSDLAFMGFIPGFPLAFTVRDGDLGGRTIELWDLQLIHSPSGGSQ